MDILLVAGFKISFIPTAALEAEYGRRNFLFQIRSTTGRAIPLRIITDFLECFQLMLAALALVLIYWHKTDPAVFKGRGFYRTFAQAGSFYRGVEILFQTR